MPNQPEYDPAKDIHHDPAFDVLRAEDFKLPDGSYDVMAYADAYMKIKYPQPSIVTNPRKVYIPVPRIERGPKSVQGPVIVTTDWYKREKERWGLERQRDRRRSEIKLIQLLAEEDYMKIQLKRLDPGRKKDSKKIAAINARLHDLRIAIDEFGMVAGLDIKSIEKATRVQRFLTRLRRRVKRGWKKFKRMCSENMDMIVPAIIAVIPFAAKLLAKIVI